MKNKSNCLCNIILLLVFILLPSLALGRESEIHQAPAEFVINEVELAETGKWRNKSFDALTEDALKGDRGALHMLGMCFLIGHEFSINVERANLFFKQAASLGFAPSLDKLKSMYVEQGNVFLALVYFNLAVSFGHHELVVEYHNVREKFVKSFGENFMQEVERVAECKSRDIFKNKEKYNNLINKEKFWTEITHITDEDIIYNIDYQARFCKKQKQ